jgi:predicted methyltransferase
VGEVTGNLVQMKTGGTVIDVGANVGSFARLASEVVGNSGRVIAIEPIPVVSMRLACCFPEFKGRNSELRTHETANIQLSCSGCLTWNLATHKTFSAPSADF